MAVVDKSFRSPGFFERFRQVNPVTGGDQPGFWNRTLTTDLGRSPRWGAAIGLKSGSVKRLKGIKSTPRTLNAKEATHFGTQSAVIDLSLNHIVTF
jgi:hypothetical protein